MWTKILKSKNRSSCIMFYLVISFFCILFLGCGKKEVPITTPEDKPLPVKVWQKTYGGSGSDSAYSIQQTHDGGYIVAGFTRSFGAGGSDFYLIKTDGYGNTEPYPTKTKLSAGISNR